MLDPLTALGLARNVLRVLDFGFRLVADGNQIYHSATGALEENKAVDELAKDLESLTKRLTESQREWTKSRGDVPLEPDELHLRNICERCTEIAIELQRLLQKLRRQDGANRHRLKSYRQALISVWRKDHIAAVAARLARYQQELDTHILVGIRKSVQEAEWKSSQQFASLERQTQQLTIAILEGDGKINSRLSGQAEVLERVYEQTSQIVSSLENGHASTLPPPAYRGSPDALTTALHEAAKDGNLFKVKQLLRSATTDVNAQDQGGCRPLHLTSTADVTKRLLSDLRTEKNAEDLEDRTPLHHAVLKRRLGTVQALLEAGVDSTSSVDT